LNIPSSSPLFQRVDNLSRVFPITEGIHLKLLVNAFNATNTPIFDNPTTEFTDADFGDVTRGAALIQSANRNKVERQQQPEPTTAKAKTLSRNKDKGKKTLT
jgi:hypothetical protein